MLRFSLFIIVLSGAAFLAQGAGAQDVNAETVTLSTRGVDFAKPSDVQAFHAKLQKAAHEVCDIQGDSLMIRQDDKACRDLALDEAIDSLHKPLLTQLHQENVRAEPKQIADAARAKRW